MPRKEIKLSNIQRYILLFRIFSRFVDNIQNGQGRLLGCRVEQEGEGGGVILDILLIYPGWIL